MDRTERLLDLVALLLDASEPVSWSTIREAFPDEYGGSSEAGERKFERDKAELLELGLPLTWKNRSDEQAEGYVIDKSAYYLPPPDLKPDELAVLYAAGSAALAAGVFPGRDDLAHALRKISFFADGELPTPRVRLELSRESQGQELHARLESLWSAINTRKRVTLDYFSPRAQAQTTRQVDPWGLALRRGLWTLVGYCHLRNDVRVFHVHRMRSVTVNAQKPRTPDFDTPANFRLDDWVASWPWQYRFHPPVDATVRLTGDLAPLATSLFDVEPTPRPDGVVEVTVRATDLEGLVTYVLAQGPEARLVAPAEAVERQQQLARAVLAAHTQPGGAS